MSIYSRDIKVSIIPARTLDLWKRKNGHINVDSEGTVVQLSGEQFSSIILIKLQDLTVLRKKFILQF